METRPVETVTELNVTEMQPLYPLSYGDEVLLKWDNPECYVSSQGISPENLALSLILRRHIQDLKMASFKMVRVGFNRDAADNFVYHGDEIKLWHVHSEKFVTLGGTHFGSKDRQVDLSDGSEGSKVCKFKIFNQITSENRIMRSKEVKFKAGTYTLTLDENTKGLTWHDNDDSTSATSEKYPIIQDRSSIIPKGIIEVIKKRRVFTRELQKKLKNELNKSVYNDCQYRLIQNYLRELKVVDEVCELFSCDCDIHKNETVKLIKLLIKICMGNFENQKIFLKSKVYTKPINAILKEDLSKVTIVCQDDSEQQCLQSFNSNQVCCKVGESNMKAIRFLKLKALAVSLLEVLCEEIHKDTENNVQTLITYIDVIDLHKALFNCYMLRDLKDGGIGELAHDTAVKIHNLLKHMEDFKGIKAVPSKNLLKLQDWNPKSELINSHYTDQDHQKAWNYCLKWSRSIEILYKNEEGDERLAKVYFRLHSEDKMTAKEEHIVKHHVNCGAPKNRLTQFVLGMKSIEKKVHPWCSFQERSRFVRFSELSNYVLTFWTVIMNILLIIAWETTDMRMKYVYNSPELDVISPSNESDLSSYCVDAVCYNTNVTDSIFILDDCNRSLCVAETHIPTVPAIRYPHWFFSYFLYIGGIFHSFMSAYMLIIFFIINGPDFKIRNPKNICAHLKYSCYKFYMFLLNEEKPLDYFKDNEIPRYFEMPLHTSFFRLVYISGFFACSVLALVFYGYFYCFCLLHIVVENTILQRVLRSVTKNFLKLFWLLALGLVMVYIYSVAAFAFFANEFHDPDSRGAQYCDTLLQCCVTIFHYILIGGTPNLPSNFKDFAIRVIIFEVTFYLVIAIIGINIFYAIVVDTFIQLREEWWQIERDHKQICFICQKFSSEFEEKAQGFDHHIFNDHYMFNYVYFKLHIDKVDKHKRNAMEWYVSKKIEETRTDFFPLNRARCLHHTWTEKKLKEIKKTVDDIKNNHSYSYS